MILVDSGKIYPHILNWKCGFFKIFSIMTHGSSCHVETPSLILWIHLQEQNPKVKCYLIDPPGSGLYNRVTRGVMYSREEAEGKRMRNPFDTITEGIGINRITENFKQACLDGAFRGTDKEAVEMARLVFVTFPLPPLFLVRGPYVVTLLN